MKRFKKGDAIDVLSPDTMTSIQDNVTWTMEKRHCQLQHKVLDEKLNSVNQKLSNVLSKLKTTL